MRRFSPHFPLLYKSEEELQAEILKLQKQVKFFKHGNLIATLIYFVRFGSIVGITLTSLALDMPFLAIGTLVAWFIYHICFKDFLYSFPIEDSHLSSSLFDYFKQRLTYSEEFIVQIDRVLVSKNYVKTVKMNTLSEKEISNLNRLLYIYSALKKVRNQVGSVLSTVYIEKFLKLYEKDRYSSFSQAFLNYIEVNSELILLVSQEAISFEKKVLDSIAVKEDSEKFKESNDSYFEMIRSFSFDLAEDLQNLYQEEVTKNSKYLTNLTKLKSDSSLVEVDSVNVQNELENLHLLGTLFKEFFENQRTYTYYTLGEYLLKTDFNLNEKNLSLFLKIKSIQKYMDFLSVEHSMYNRLNSFLYRGSGWNYSNYSSLYNTNMVSTLTVIYNFLSMDGDILSRIKEEDSYCRIESILKDKSDKKTRKKEVLES